MPNPLLTSPQLAISGSVIFFTSAVGFSLVAYIISDPRAGRITPFSAWTTHYTQYIWTLGSFLYALCGVDRECTVDVEQAKGPPLVRAATACIALAGFLGVGNALIRLLTASRVRIALKFQDTDSLAWYTCACLSWLLVHVLVTLVYYCRVYDAEGTYKPAWAEYLG